MTQEFEQQLHDAACRVMGEAVWHLVSSGQWVTQDSIADMIVALSEGLPNLADSIALSILRQE